MVLVRAEGREPFTDGETAAVRQFGLLGSAALALASVERSERDVERIGRQIADLRRTEQRAKRECDVLRTLIDALPVCLTLHNREGRLILANAAAHQASCLPWRHGG